MDSHIGNQYRNKPPDLTDLGSVRPIFEKDDDNKNRTKHTPMGICI